MFGLFGGRNKKRQIQNEDRKHSNKGKHHPQVAEQQPTPSHNEKPNHPFFDDDNSLDMSLYTTPSKATLQYYGGVPNQHDWQSVDSAVTPEVASVQSKLGGWEAPPPQAMPRNKEGPSQPKRRHSTRNETSISSSKAPSVKRPSSFSAKASTNTFTNLHIVGTDADLSASFHDTQSLDSNVRLAGPIDVDSLEIVEPAPPDNFSDLFSTFEAQSLAGRMAPNTAALHHERAKMTKVDARAVTLQQQESSGAISSQRSPGTSSKTSSSKRTHPLITFPTDASNMIQEDLPMVEFDDESRSLVTDVSGLTMLTMEQQSGTIQSQKAQSGRNPQLSSPVSEASSPSKISLPEEASFLGLLSKVEAESLADRLAPTTKNAEEHMVAEKRTGSYSDSRLEQELPEKGASDTNSSVGSTRSSRSTSTPPEEDYAATLKMSKLSPLTMARTTVAKQSAFSREPSEPGVGNGPNTEHSEEASRQSPPILSASSEKSSQRENEGKSTRKSKKEKKKKKKKKKKSSKKDRDNVRERSLNNHSQKSLVLPSLENAPEDVSFCGLFSTIEDKSLAGRLDSSSSIPQLVLSNDLCEDDDTQAQDLHSIGMASLSSSFHHQTMADMSPRKRTIKRSNISSKASVASEESASPSDEESTTNGTASGFSNILSVFEVKSASANGLEPPATKRLLPSGDFPINAHEDGNNDIKLESTLHAAHSDSSLELACVDQIDDSQTIHTIGDESTIPPPPLPDDDTWDEGLFSPPKEADEAPTPGAQGSVVSLPKDEMFDFPATEKAESNWQHLENTRHVVERNVERREEEDLTDAETSLQYSESIDSSLVYSVSTAPATAFSSWVTWISASSGGM